MLYCYQQNGIVKVIMFYAYYILRIFQKKATTFRKGGFPKTRMFLTNKPNTPPPLITFLSCGNMNSHVVIKYVCFAVWSPCSRYLGYIPVNKQSFYLALFRLFFYVVADLCQHFCSVCLSTTFDPSCEISMYHHYRNTLSDRFIQVYHQSCRHPISTSVSLHLTLNPLEQTPPRSAHAHAVWLMSAPTPTASAPGASPRWHIALRVIYSRLPKSRSCRPIVRGGGITIGMSTGFIAYCTQRSGATSLSPDSSHFSPIKILRTPLNTSIGVSAADLYVRARNW